MSYAEQLGLLKNPGDVIVSVGKESMKGKSYITVKEAMERAKSVLELTLWAKNQCIVSRSPVELPENNNDILPSEFQWIQKGTKYNVLDGVVEHGAEALSLPYYFENNWFVDITWLTAPERKGQKVPCTQVTGYLYDADKRPVRVRNIPKRFADQKFDHVRRNTSKLKTGVENSRKSQGSTSSSVKKSDDGRDIRERQTKVRNKQTDVHKETWAKKERADCMIKKENKGDEVGLRCPLNASRRGCGSSNNTVKLPCNHEFCRPCIHKMLKNAKDVITYELTGRPDEKFSTKLSCPMCRKKYSSRTISRLLEENKAIVVDNFQ
jgi:hypothetical protein